MKDAKDQFLVDPTVERKVNLGVLKKELFAAYTKARDEALTEKIVRVERVVDESKLKEAGQSSTRSQGGRGGFKSDPGAVPEDRKSK